MKKTLLLLTLIASMMSVRAQIVNPQFAIDDENGTSAMATLTWFCGDSSEAFAHFDTSAAFLNAWSTGNAAVFPPGQHTITFTASPLLNNFESFIRATVRSYNDTVQIIEPVQTTSQAVAGGLVGQANSPTDVQLTCYFMDHGSDVTIVYLRKADSAVVAMSNGLRDPWIGADTVYFTQPSDTSITYTRVAWNVSNPNPFDWSYDPLDTFVMTTPAVPPLPANDPYLDTMQLVSVTATDVEYHIHGQTDSVSAFGYLQLSSDNWASFTTLTADYLTPGYFSIDVQGTHNVAPGSTLYARYVIINNVHGSQHTDTIWQTVTVPIPSIVENLVPFVVSIDQMNRDIYITVHRLNIGASGADLYLHCVNAIDTGGTTWSISRSLTSTDTSYSRSFHGAAGQCYVMRTLIVENGILRQSGYWEFDASSACLTSTGIDGEEDWDGAVHELSPVYFEKNNGADVIVANMLGQSEFRHFATWSEMYDNLKSGVSVVSTLPHKRTNAVWAMKFVK